MSEKAKKVLELANSQCKKAKKAFDENNLNDSVNYIWAVFENCLNIIKDIKNNKPIYEHKPKIDMFRAMNIMGILKQDYSEHFRRLEKFRLTATFGGYANAPPLPKKEIIEDYLKKCNELLKETDEICKDNLNKKSQ